MRKRRANEIQESQRKEMINIRVEINEAGSRKTIEKIIETKT